MYLENKEKIFSVKKIDPMILYGISDENLKIIEKYFPTQLIARGNQIKIIGASESVKIVEDVLSELVFVANKNGQLDPKDVEMVVHIVQSNKSNHNAKNVRVHSADELEEVVLFTKKGFIKPRTKGQKKLVYAANRNDILIVIGPAGTGKTYLAVAMAINALKNKEVRKIVLARPAVEAGENLGFLPGDYREKIDPYLRPLIDALEEMIPKEVLRKYIEQGIVEIIPLAFMRGRTLNNSFVIMDEAQNSSSMQMKMCLTRLGVNSRAIINGDITQIDLPKNTQSGLVEILEVLNNIDGIEFIYLDESDVVRHRLVRDIIHAYGKKQNHNKEES
jgi:phosphate starvation-inducible PhoH-like protein